jgi:hypothetical protein
MPTPATQAPHHSLLAHDTPAVLARDLPPEGVLSLVLNVNPASAVNQGGGLRLRARQLLAASDAPEGLVNSVLNDLESAQRSTRTRLSFLWDEHGHVRQRGVDAQLSLPESAHFGAPDLEPLHGALESSPRVLIVLAGDHWGRLFGIYLGTIRELYRLENVLEPDGTFRVHDRSGNPPSQLSERGAPQHRDAQQGRRFQQALLAQVQRLRQVGVFEHLLVAGSVRGRADLRAQLDADLERALAGDLPMTSDASAADLLALAGPALARIEQETEAALLGEALERGTVGVEATLQAAQEGRVRQLLMAGVGVRVWQDTSGSLFAALPDRGRSPLTGGPVEERALRDVLAALRERFGLTVRFLMGPSAERLDAQLGGLAGVPRA